MAKNGITTCYRMGCTNPVVIRADEMPACGKHGGETKIVWSVYRELAGWLSDNDTVIEWTQDVDQARWFESHEDVADALVEYELVAFTTNTAIDGFYIVRLK